MGGFGILLLMLVAAGIVLTGLPAALVLLGVAGIGAIAATASGVVPPTLLALLPGRLINLLENDLLQALPLYVLMGVLLDRLPVAEAIYRNSLTLLPRSRAAPLVACMGLGALLGPMNGSVGASVLGLSRVVAPRLAQAGVPAATRAALIAVASTLGVVIPPSLVLILLGDAMLSAHTIAVTVTGRLDRVINTQDLFHGAIAPAGIFLLLGLFLSWLSGRVAGAHDLPDVPKEEFNPHRAALAGLAVIAIVALLASVAAGYCYAVEAAAMGAFVLLVGGLLTGRLTRPVLRHVVHDVMAITGALFALLVAATTFTLVLRLLGTDRLIDGWIATLPGGDKALVAVVLGVIGLCAFVLDAFEIIFVIVPIIIPPLLVRIADAQWVAVLVLLALQTSFLLPPFGYALMMVRGTLPDTVPLRALARALAPFLLAQWAVLIMVLVMPSLVHVAESPESRTRATAVPLTAEELNRRLGDMLPPVPDLPSPDPPERPP